VGVDFECVPLDLVCFTLAISKIMRDIFCAFFCEKRERESQQNIYSKHFFCEKWERESQQNIYSAQFFCEKAGVGISAKYFFCAFFLRKGGSGYHRARHSSEQQ
jgi:hypothetical protein